MTNYSLQDELPTRSTTNTPTFLETCALDGDHKALEEHLENNLVQQRDLDRCLLRGLRVVQRKKRELSDVAPSLTLLLQSGAKHAMLARQKTPLHIICESPGDHHELLDLLTKSSRRTIINRRDIDACSALLYAVRNDNVNCVKCLIANGADVTIGYKTYTNKTRFSDEMKLLNPIMEAIRLLSFRSGHSSTVIMSKIFDLLFDAAVEKNRAHFRNCTAYILCAVAYRNVHSLKKLIKIGAPLDIIAYDKYYVWELVTSIGNVELLKCVYNRGIYKDMTGEKGHILWWVFFSKNIEAVRYLLDIGVAIPTCTAEERTTQCETCKENRLIIEDYDERKHRDEYQTAILLDKVKIVKLLDEYGRQSCQSFTALRYALRWGSVRVVSYLLSKHTYTLNIEYNIKDSDERISTLLTDPLTSFVPQNIKLLLDHGADPAKRICSATSINAIMAAIGIAPLEVIVQYIRSGVDINFRSWANKYGNVTPFELSVLKRRHYVSVILLVSGCSREEFSIQKCMAEHKPKLEKLMKEWNVNDNDVTPLKQRCRCVILNHLSPRADLKIEKLPLPPCLIKFLCIPELDNIVQHFSYIDIAKY